MDRVGWTDIIARFVVYLGLVGECILICYVYDKKLFSNIEIN